MIELIYCLILDEQPYFSEGKAPLQNEFGNLNNKMPVNGADNKSRTYLTSPAPIISASNNTVRFQV